MANLIIDTGNTFHKIAVIGVDNNILEERVVAELTEEVVDELYKSSNISHVRVAKLLKEKYL